MEQGSKATFSSSAFTDKYSDQGSSFQVELRQLHKSVAELNLNQEDRLNQLLGILEPLMAHRAGDPFSVRELPAVRGWLSAAASAASEISREQVVLNSLHFQSIHIREANIPEAHAKTFQWMFDRARSMSSESHRNIRYLEWLQQSGRESGVFWIGGKAGSGKSTLMKFIYYHPETKRALDHWAKGYKVVIASFFFWHAGTILQKSQEGLMQSLLFEIFRKCPEVISEVCSRRYKSALTTDQEIWSRAELLETLSNSSTQNKLPAKFCLFIDGLDEYYGHPAELVKALGKLAKMPNIKICVSSRPWEVFKKAYDHPGQSLYLQDLTRGDIELYVRNQLEEHEEFHGADSRNIVYNMVVHTITGKAKGVFLWVFLAVRSILTGLDNGDTIEILQERLEELPDELEELFRRMLDGVDKVYREKSSRTFQVALAAVGPLSTMAYSFLDEKAHQEISTLGICPLKDPEICRRQKQMQKQVNAISKGLLEVTLDPYTQYVYFKFKVDFLHRTVREFLCEHQDRLWKAFNPETDVHISICQALLAVLKACPLELKMEDSNLQAFNEIFEDIAYHARQAKSTTGKTQTAILDEVRSVVAVRSGQNLAFERWANSSKSAPHFSLAQTHFDAFCVKMGLCLYLEERFKRKPALARQSQRHPKAELGQNLLEIALMPPLHSRKYEDFNGFPVIQLLLQYLPLNSAMSSHDSTPSCNGCSTTWSRFLKTFQTAGWSVRNLELVQLLLREGADPNVQRPGGEMIWADFLHPNPRICSVDQLPLVEQVIEAFLDRGAHPNQGLYSTASKVTVWQKHMINLGFENEGECAEKALYKHFDFRVTRTLIFAGADLGTTISPPRSNRKTFSVWDIICTYFPGDQGQRLSNLIRQEHHRDSDHLARVRGTDSLSKIEQQEDGEPSNKKAENDKFKKPRQESEQSSMELTRKLSSSRASARRRFEKNTKDSKTTFLRKLRVSFASR